MQHFRKVTARVSKGVPTLPFCLFKNKLKLDPLAIMLRRGTGMRKERNPSG